MTSNPVESDLEVYDIGDIYDQLHETRWRETPFPVLDDYTEEDSFDPTLPPNVNEMDLDDLKRWLRTYTAWMEYISNQKVLIDAMVRSLERQLERIENGLKVDIWNQYGKKPPPEDIRKALVRTDAAWVAADGDLSKQESLKAAMAARLEKLGRSKGTIETLITARQSELKFERGGG